MAESRPHQDDIERAFRGVIERTPDAPAALIELLLYPLVTALTRKYSGFADHNIVVDIVTDSLFRLITDPSRYQPERGGLWNYLYMDADGDLKNAWQRVRRQRAREVAFDPVAHDVADGNINTEAEVLNRLAPQGLPSGADPAQVISELRSHLEDPRDWAVLLLWAHGEKRTEAFAQVLEIETLPIAEQRRLVKQAKDRVRLKTKRWGRQFSER